MKPVMPWKPVLCDTPSCVTYVVPSPPVEVVHCQRVGMFQFSCQNHLYSHNTLPQITLPKPGYWLKSSWFTLPKEPKLLSPPYGDQWHQDISGLSQHYGKFGTTAGIWWLDGKRLARTTVMPWKSGQILFLYIYVQLAKRQAGCVADQQDKQKIKYAELGCHTPLLYL